mgnify:FL=1
MNTKCENAKIENKTLTLSEVQRAKKSEFIVLNKEDSAKAYEIQKKFTNSPICQFAILGILRRVINNKKAKITAVPQTLPRVPSWLLG